MTFQEKLSQMETLMRQGVQTDKDTGLTYYTGYSYNSLYDWDQYFEGLVQLYMGWGAKYLKNSVKIFLAHQQEGGHVPRAVDPPEMDRPNEKSEMVKPFLCQILCLVLREEGNCDFLKEEDWFERLTLYMTRWLFGLDKRGAGLSYWRSSPHTGMDNQRERAGDWGADFCEGIDLNAFLLREIEAYKKLCVYLGNAEMAQKAAAWYESRKEAVLAQCWDEKTGFFYDVDARTGERMAIKSVAGFAPLWAGICTQEQADRLVQNHLMNPEEFWRPWPVPAYSAGWEGYSAMFLPGDIGCAWRCNTWIPTNYYVFQGLRRYGYDHIAAILAQKTYEMVDSVGLREYYASETCEGCGLDPFWGWSLLANFMPYESETGYDPTRLDDKDSNLARVSFALPK